VSPSGTERDYRWFTQQELPLNLTLWVVQGLLAALFLSTGYMHTLQPWEKLTKMLPAIASFPQAFVRFLGVCELLGVVGLVVPGIVIQELAGAGLPAMVVSILPWLTVAAALSFAIDMFSATILHLRRKEYPFIGVTLVLLALTLFIAYGRWMVVPF
jgi:putative oxidoreductase